MKKSNVPMAKKNLDKLIAETAKANLPSPSIANAKIDHSPYPFAKVILGKDPVNHPAHYTSGKIEVVDFIEDQKLGWHLGNALKYIARAGKKDPTKEKEDLEKAIWYINRRIQFIGALLLVCILSFGQKDPDSIIKANIFRADSSKLNTINLAGTGTFSFKPTKFYELTDSAGPFLIWVIDSDTIELIPPKIRYIKIGKRIIKL